jgi:hypothetical protein
MLKGNDKTYPVTGRQLYSMDKRPVLTSDLNNITTIDIILNL